MSASAPVPYALEEGPCPGCGSPYLLLTNEETQSAVRLEATVDRSGVGLSTFRGVLALPVASFDRAAALRVARFLSGVFGLTPEEFA